jgi:glycine oxidase
MQIPDTENQNLTRLPKNQDVLIIGGGIIGLSVARELRRRGVEKIAILEKNSACGVEASSSAAGMLAPQAEADCDDLFFRFCQESRDLYPKFAEELFEETDVDIELDQTGTLYLAFTEKDAEELEKRYAWQKTANLNIEKLSVKEVLEIEPNVSPRVLFSLRFPLDWQVENRKIIEALDLSLREAEFASAEVKSLIFENNKAVGAETNRGRIYASKIIIASGAWTSLIKDEYNLLSNLKVAPVRGQMIAFGDDEKSFRHVIYTRRGYIVPRKNCRILVGATVENAGFDCSVTDEGIVSLLKTASEISPVFEKLHLESKWAGLRPFVSDELPVIGEFPGIRNLFVATAHYRNGILLAPKTAEILADRITGVSESEYLKVFGPRRFVSAKAF